MKNLAIAIDLGASNLRAGLISKNGKILKKITKKTPKKEKIIINETIKSINELLSSTDRKKIAGIGISVAALIDLKQEKIINAPNIGLKNFLITLPLKNYFKLPIIISNDCNAAVFGEKFFGEGKKYTNIVYITISSGIGGGAIVDNHLLLGKNGSAAEIGHFIVDTKYHILCSCKKGRGHWESYCSGNNINNFFNYWIKINKINYNSSVKTSKDIFDRAKKADKIILKFLNEIGKINGRGVSNVIAAYNPEIIIFGGAVVLNNEKFIIPYLKKNIDKFLPTPKLSITRLKDNVSLCGAAAIVFEKPLN